MERTSCFLLNFRVYQRLTGKNFYRSNHPTIKSGNNNNQIYSLASVKRYIVYANVQHVNHIRCKNIKLYFFTRNRATILKQVRFDSVNRTNIAFRANQKQTKVPWDSQKKKANRNGICINLYKQDHLVYYYICHFLYACRISIYKNANISHEMWNILEAFTVLKNIF